MVWVLVIRGNQSLRSALDGGAICPGLGREGKQSLRSALDGGANLAIYRRSRHEQ